MASLFRHMLYRLRMIRLALMIQPIAGAAPDDPSDPDPDPDPDPKDPDPDPDPDPADPDPNPDDPPAAKEPNWKQQARRHEREAKKARKERDDLNQRLIAREQADKSEQETAIDQARAEERDKVKGEHEKELRADRLENAALKIAAKGLKIGSGDDAKTLRFADPDDALLHLERDIRNGDLDPDDIFNENGRVKTDQLEEALTDLLDRKPHLAAGEKNGAAKVKGTADAGKGTAAKTDETVEDHFNKVRRNKPGPQAGRYAIGRQAG